MDWLRTAIASARTQDACVTREQLIEAGASEAVLHSLVDAGWLERRRRGVYAFAGVPSSRRQQLHAALLAAGGVASHSSAAELWGFRHLPYLTLEMSVTRSTRTRQPGVHTHHVTHLPPEDVTMRFGLPTTTFERTLVDCSTTLSEFQLGANLDDGLRRRVASLSALRACAERLRSGPGRRLRVIESVLDVRPNGYHPGGSREERCLLDLLVAAGLPAPVQQYRVEVDGRTYFLDYAYPERLVFIEYYGIVWHASASAVVYDSDRVTALTSRRWLPLIFTAKTPDRVIVERTAAVLASH